MGSDSFASKASLKHGLEVCPTDLSMDPKNSMQVDLNLEPPWIMGCLRSIAGMLPGWFIHHEAVNGTFWILSQCYISSSIEVVEMAQKSKACNQTVEQAFDI